MMMTIVDDIDGLGTFFRCIDMDDMECMRVHNTFEEAQAFTNGWNSVCKDQPCIKTASFPCVSLSDCKPAPTTLSGPNLGDILGVKRKPKYNEEQESNLMAYETKTTAAVASIINAASDESKQREFLLEELRRFSPYDWRTPFDNDLQKMFNIDAPKAPRSSQELLDMFKAGAFTVDQKKVDMNTAYNTGEGACEDEDGEYVGSQYYGITFTTLPIEDRKGYTKAKEEFAAALKDTKRTIMIGTPVEGLAALKALESWKTTVIPATTTVAA